MTRSPYANLFLAGCRVHGVAVGVTLIVGTLFLRQYGCAGVTGQDVDSHSDYSRSQYAATTQQADETHVERVAATQASGGAAYASRSGTYVEVTPERVRVQTDDRKAGTTQPTVITVDKTTADQVSRTDTTAESNTKAAVEDKTEKGPTYNGWQADVLIDGDKISAKAVRSKLADRWLLVLILAGAGAYFLLPPPIRSLPNAIGFFAAAAASLVLSDFWFAAVTAFAILMVVGKHTSTAGLLTRVVGQLRDWGSDMPAHERAAFDSTLAIAAGRQRKLYDQVAVEAEHSGKIVPVPPVAVAGQATS